MKAYDWPISTNQGPSNINQSEIFMQPIRDFHTPFDQSESSRNFPSKPNFSLPSVSSETPMQQDICLICLQISACLLVQNAKCKMQNAKCKMQNPKAPKCLMLSIIISEDRLDICPAAGESQKRLMATRQPLTWVKIIKLLQLSKKVLPYQSLRAYNSEPLRFLRPPSRWCWAVSSLKTDWIHVLLQRSLRRDSWPLDNL